MSSSSSDARLRTRNESREARVDRIVIMHPDSMAVVPEIPQSLSTVHSFEQDRRSDALEKWRKLMAECFTLLRLAARSVRTIQSLR